MKKIPSLFMRNYVGDRLARNELTPGTEWVIAGEGTATRKWDGTCCFISANGDFFKRYEVKPGKRPPPNFVPACDIDPVTQKRQGWVPVGTGPGDQWHREALSRAFDIQPGTYELVGPKIQGNPEHFEEHRLIRHGADHLPHTPRTFEALRQYFTVANIEGVVWHHPDGRMAKIKTRDFGLKR